MNDKLIRAGFVAGGLVNIVGILIVTHGMTSNTIATADPTVFSTFGILSIMLWGLAYLATAPIAHTNVLLPAVFALEKLAYTVNWILWIRVHSAELEAISNQDFLGGFFLGGYGVNDALFGIFFAAIAFRNWQQAQNS